MKTDAEEQRDSADFCDAIVLEIRKIINSNEKTFPTAIDAVSIPSFKPFRFKIKKPQTTLKTAMKHEIPEKKESILLSH